MVKKSQQPKSGAESGRTERSAYMSTDHEEIRRWAEERGGKPACVKGTGRGGGDTGMIRIDFPGYSGEESLQEISWEDWFRAFEENELALLVLPDTEDVAGGRKSRFNKIVSRHQE